MADYPVLGLFNTDFARNDIQSYQARVDDQTILNDAHTKVDRWVGQATASFGSTMYISGALAAGFANQVVYAEYTPTARVIKELVCFAVMSGSGGVTAVDVQ